MKIISSILEVEAYAPELDAMVFDLDDTLYSEKEYVRSGFHQIAALFPEIPDAEVSLWKFFLDKKPAIDCFIEKERISKDLKKKCLDVYRFQKPDICLYPGVHDMLLRLKKQIKLGLITDGRPEGQHAKIRVLGLESIFDYIIITDELGGASFRKPNTTAFKLMAEALNVNNAKMCYIGDNIQKDIAGAEALGMTAILFQNRDGLYAL